jgi:hypothetical protein
MVSKELCVLGLRIPISSKDLSEENLNGYFDPKNHHIVIDSSLSADEYCKTLIHETIHAAFYRGSISQALEDGVEEIICDLLATVLSENFSITEASKKIVK